MKSQINGFDPTKNQRTKNQEKLIYPQFKFVTEGCNPEFSALVQQACQDFYFNELPSKTSKYLKSLKKNGTDKKICEKEHFSHVLVIEDFVFLKCLENGIKKYLPFNHIRIFLEDKNIVVWLRSLKSKKLSHGEIYYSSLEPKIEIEGIKYIVAFSKHAIDQIMERISINSMTASGLSIIFAYLQECIFFELCELKDRQLAITFWDRCCNPIQLWNQFGIGEDWQGQYIKEVLGELDPAKGDYYFRVGYCPIVRENNFVIAKTLLYPGFSKTPEYKCLEVSNLPELEKKKIKHKATQANAKFLRETQDFSHVKWFHLNGVRQVMQTRDKIFQQFHENEEKIM